MNQVLGSRMEPGYVRAGVIAEGPVAETSADVAGLASGKSAASWPAIVAGAVVTVSASLVLIILGSGLGFAAVSPWPGRGASVAGLTVVATIWLIVTQWISAALGGYIAGRLRTKWTGTHTHEVFFRDTAHGLITWSVATVFIAWVVAGSASSLLGGGLHAAAGAATAAAAGTAGSAQGPASAAMTYDIDRLFRSSASTPAGAGSTGTITPGAGAGSAGTVTTGSAAGISGSADNASDARIETLYIAYHAMAAGNVPDTDRSYLAELVASQTGVSVAEAQHRVDEFISATLAAEAKARADADAARKAAAQASIYTALSLLIGAFIASVCAALGGRLRDEHV
jgi:hypothetical protein